MTTTDTNLTQLIIHELTKAQYEALTPEANQLYLTPDTTDQDIAAAINAVIPSQSGNSGKFLTTNGTSTSWGTVEALPSQTSQSGKFLTTDGSAASWANIPTEIPSQSGNNGKFLTTNGTSVSWANIPTEIPSQTSQSGKFLTTDGSSVSWATVDALPSQTSQAGKFLTTDGSSASWGTITVPTKISDLTDDTSTYPVDKADTLTGLTASITELNYVDGVTSAIQTQLNNKQNSSTAVTHTASTAVGSGTQPIYIASDGTATTTTYALNKTVPSDAVFTDTTYSVFTGADGSTAGTSGLVPQPAATDNTKFLKGDGTWGTVDTLPSQSGNSGKFLTTNGTSASWGTVDTLPSQTGNANKVLTTNGTTASWTEQYSREIGEIVQSTIPLTDAGLHLLDGSQLSGSGIYADFVDYISGLTSTYSNLFCTEAEWQQSVTDYGVCGKFVYDNTNDTVRLPKTTSNKRHLIKSYSSGTTWHRIYSDGWCEQGATIAAGTSTVTFAIPFTTAPLVFNYSAVPYSGGYLYEEYTAYPTSTGYTRYYPNMITTYEAKGYIDILDYQTTTLYEYIVVATTTKTDIQVDIDEIATDLNGKVDKSSLVASYPVIETYSSGYSWYIIYAADETGYRRCVQGSTYYKGSTVNGDNIIMFMKTFKDTAYTLQITTLHSSANLTCYSFIEKYPDRTTTSAKIYTASAPFGYSWIACGYIANEV